MRRLNVLPADVAPRAAAHIPEMVQMIEGLIEAGFAYAAEGSVYYAVEKFAGYGKLSGNSVDALRAGDRVIPEPGTQSPLDFALWKAAKPGEPAWRSPWGPGRPGWHIECSAMATRYLGPTIDIHGGGSDLIFPHHENEIAQSEAACSCGPFASLWLHNGHVQMDGEKMSKSLRNYVLVTEMLADYEPQVLRLFILAAHYRSPISYAVSALDEARAQWDRFAAFLRAAPAGGTAAGHELDAFGEAMDDDLATPRAIAALHGIVAAGHKAIESGDTKLAASLRAALVEGLGILGIEEASAGGGTDALGPLVEYLLELRSDARAAKDFERADAIRARLESAGVVVEDTPQGARWHLS
jgi:cysteinyl-tRNA synthetase